MQKILSIAVLAAALAGGFAPSVSSAEGPRLQASQPDLKKVGDHLRQHVKYPATRAQLLAACADTPEFSAAEKKWFADRLAEGTYASVEQVLSALSK